VPPDGYKKTNCFNGATSFQTWKLGAESNAWLKTVLLQWGHVFSDVEILVGWIKAAGVGGFNGATSFQTWKYLSVTSTIDAGG